MISSLEVLAGLALEVWGLGMLFPVEMMTLAMARAERRAARLPMAVTRCFIAVAEVGVGLVMAKEWERVERVVERLGEVSAWIVERMEVSMPHFWKSGEVSATVLVPDSSSLKSWLLGLSWRARMARRRISPRNIPETRFSNIWMPGLMLSLSRASS